MVQHDDVVHNVDVVVIADDQLPVHVLYLDARTQLPLRPPCRPLGQQYNNPRSDSTLCHVLGKYDLSATFSARIGTPLGHLCLRVSLQRLAHASRTGCDGVSAENARKTLVPGSPLMTMSGVINRLRWVECY
ncbi:hypothetical protein SRIMHP_02640 [Streptomyces rimosus subsp. rimosus]|uniref:Uncharacterized protein n=1 Tax=Streptomyces rimosus subsp. rimosus TaxID=132474 RepID=A0ABY3YXQ5_STRRM|nr:hypothetical protein SRIMR7_02640 [Streptomyces rimosus subsp. rimosus]UTH93011.1 hypothetical protein SRIMHP_02640 [Streptomyces rimosus subsp. rimosus]UTJ11107.1 hypothetical protein SRIMDV3_02540 [Streptomyces rimosus subsp. rimosus]